MPSSSRLKYLISDGYNQNDKTYCLDAYNEWQASNCYHPMMQEIYDAHTGSTRKIEIACGKCYHCRETKINSWVTRMYAHLEDFKNAYFITLTYKSYSPNLHPAEKLMLSKLGDAAFVLDDLNETKRLCFSPSLLIKSHYQNFLKRLRKYSGLDDLTYVLCGEYGKTYGRPHFHAILFTNHTLTSYDIKRAWSIALYRDKSNNWQYRRNQSLKQGTAYNVSIGKVDFHDLVQNGTLNTTGKVKVDGTFLNAANCFAYVCKYICKQDNYNKSRVIQAYHQLFQTRNFVDIRDCSINKAEAVEFLRKAGIKYNIYSLTNLLKTHSYDEIIPYHGKNLFPFNFQRSKVLHFSFDLFGNRSIAIETIPRDKDAFVKQYAPFVEYSRGTPIASLYANRHIHEFAQGVYKAPVLQSASYVLPRYFCDKAKDYIFGLRRVRKTLKGKSLYLGCLPDLYRHMQAALEDVHPRYLYSCRIENYQDLVQALESDRCFHDKWSGIKYIFPVVQNNVSVQGYYYARPLKRYVLVHVTDFCSFAQEFLHRMDDEYKRYNLSLACSKQILKDKDAAFSMLSDMGVDTISLQNEYERKQDMYLHRKQKDYDQLHIAIE